MGNTLKKKKGFSMPHVYAVILILMLLVTIMTYVIPAGTYARVDGNVDPNSFTYAVPSRSSRRPGPSPPVFRPSSSGPRAGIW